MAFSQQEGEVQQQQAWSRPACRWLLLLAIGIVGGCHQAKSPVATAADVASAQADAQQEVEEARIEARKGVKSAVKIMGPDSRNASIARMTGTFDIAMARADGDHKVAIEKCLTLPSSAQQSCKDQADSDYQTAAAGAKAVRVSQQQPREQ
jgi:hypothetical protein